MNDYRPIYVVIPDATKEEMEDYWGPECAQTNFDCAVCANWAVWKASKEMVVTFDRTTLLTALKKSLL